MSRAGLAAGHSPKPPSDDPYGLALKFTVEPLLDFLDASGETQLPIVAEARGKNEDHALRQDFAGILALTTAARSAAQQPPLDLSLAFQPKRNNVVGNPIADLCAYPCARHILNPSRSNPPYEIVRRKLYQKGQQQGQSQHNHHDRQDAPGCVWSPGLHDGGGGG